MRDIKRLLRKSSEAAKLTIPSTKTTTKQRNLHATTADVESRDRKIRKINSKICSKQSKSTRNETQQNDSIMLFISKMAAWR